MAYIEKTDKIIKEGWWKKKGGKGHVDKISKNRYVVLTDHYLDFYARPAQKVGKNEMLEEMIRGFFAGTAHVMGVASGDKRLSCILLDSVYVRIHADQQSLVIGNTMKNGKEFRLTTEGHDGSRINEWYQAITKAIDDFKDSKRDGKTRVTVHKGGAHDRPDKAIAGKTEYIVSETTSPAIGMAAAQYKPVAVAPISPAPQVHTIVHSAPTVAAPPVHTVVHNPMMNPGMHHTVVSSAPPMVTSPGAQHTTYITSPSQPMMTTVMAPPQPYGMTQVHMAPPPQMISCAFCRQVFQQPPGSSAFGCPYCRQVNQAPGMTTTTVSYGAPPVFM